MARRTRKELGELVHSIKEGTGLDLWVEYSGVPQRPRVFSGTGRPISPRGTVTEIYTWMEAFMTGFDACVDGGAIKSY